MAGSGPLNRTRLTELFKELDNELRHQRGRVVMYIAGGARMALEWSEARTTSDVDGVIREGHGEASKAIITVGRRHGLTDSWMNEQMAGGLPRGKDPGETTLFHGRALTIKGASARWMLAMKTTAGRAVDISDAQTLIEHLQIKTTREVQELVTELYPDIKERKLAEVDATLEELALQTNSLVSNHTNQERDEPQKKARQIRPDEGAPARPRATTTRGPTQGQGRKR